MNKIVIVLILVFLSFSSIANDFKYNITKWKNFKFGQDWSITKEQMNESCLRTNDYDDGSINGYSCGKWLGLNVDLMVMSDEGGFFGIGKKLIKIQIQTSYSKNNENIILNFLNKEFKLMREYKCWYKKENAHVCNIIYKNGAVIYEDTLWADKQKRELNILLSSSDVYKPDAFKK